MKSILKNSSQRYSGAQNTPNENSPILKKNNKKINFTDII